MKQELTCFFSTAGKRREKLHDIISWQDEGNPIGNDNSETVTVTLTMLVFQPSGMTPLTA